jgi:predicted DNA-binding transcriptional regulator AlpA
MQVLRLPEVQKRVAMSRSSIYAAVANRTFPAPIKLSSSERARSVGWIAHEIDEYLVDRVKARTSAGGGVA